jgi:hypothetical protein
MKFFDRRLQQLFETAARAPQSPAGSPSPSLEQRVIAGWRSAEGDDEFALLLSSLFRRAVVCAALVMVLSAGWGWWQDRNAAPGAAALATYVAEVQLPP